MRYYSAKIKRREMTFLEKVIHIFSQYPSSHGYLNHYDIAAYNKDGAMRVLKRYLKDRLYEYEYIELKGEEVEFKDGVFEEECIITEGVNIFNF